MKMQPKPVPDIITCALCGKEFQDHPLAGTKNRNHCPYCLSSKHVDKNVGDRKSSCGGIMKPIGLTFKVSEQDRYGEKRQGEIMLIHECKVCHKISLNRLAGDDDPETILSVFQDSLLISESKKQNLLKENIRFAGKIDEKEIKSQLFGFAVSN